ncbi:MAG TPA: HDOD domain-containing protein [candidate division Zixibacteria bacterium]|nr:HDOD domain-containing protein [candidate division Zixibacteria bacterium]
MPDTIDEKTATRNDDAIENVISAVGELPASPAIVSSVMGLTSDLDSNVTDISRVLSSDQSLTAKVLKLSNSSFYGRSKGVRTLQEAVLILGFFTVRSLVVATSTHSMYMKDDEYGLKKKLWQHSLSSAVTARQLAERIGYDDGDELFIAALLHDIGKLVMMQKMSKQYEEIVVRVQDEQREFYDVEHEVFGFSHDQVAKVLLESWSFPESIIESVCWHHQLPPIEEGIPVPGAYLINLSNSVAKSFGVGFNNPVPENIADLESARVFGLNEDDINEIAARAFEQYQSEVGIFEEA